MVSRTGQAVLLPMLLMHVAVLMVTAPRASTATQRSTASFSSFFPSQQVTEAEFFSTIYQRHTHVDKANSTNSDGSALAHFNALIGGGDDVLMLADVNMLCNAVMDLGAPSSALRVCVVCGGGGVSVVWVCMNSYLLPCFFSALIFLPPPHFFSLLTLASDQKRGRDHGCHVM